MGSTPGGGSEGKPTAYQLLFGERDAAIVAKWDRQERLKRRWLMATLAVGAAMFVAKVCGAQTVRLESLAPTALNGWVRTTVDRPIPASGRIGTTQFVRGRQTGLDTHAVDLRVSLAPGATLAVDLATATPEPFTLGPLANFGGFPTIAGQPMQLVAFAADGAAWTAHYRARTGPMLVTDLWLRWYPGEGWAHGEALVTASNPSVPDMGATVPAGFALSFGDAVVVLPGRGTAVPLLQAGTTFADGQARAVPLVFVWNRMLTAATWPSAIAASQLAVSAVGIGKLLADGNPSYPVGFDAKAWASGKFAQAFARAHDWGGAVCGPAMASGTAGEQEDSAFTRGEGLQSPPAATVIYLSALKLANRPCHHREADGSQLDASRHVNPRLVLWDMRPHWHAGVSPDRLGKPAGLTAEQASGWWGADVEHAMFATLAAGARYTGSPACQHLLGAIARNYPLQWTTQAGWSTSQPFAARAVGWEGILAVHLWRELEDRALAVAVRAHWQQRAALVLVPQLGSKPDDWWDVRVDDPRLGAGARVIPWQHAIGAYGLDLAGAQFDVPAARGIALRAARKVLAQAWKLGADGKWQSCPSGLRTNGTDGVFDHSFDHYAMPLAAIVLLRHRASATPAEIAKAEAIIAQVKGSATLAKHTAWIAPGVQ